MKVGAWAVLCSAGLLPSLAAADPIAGSSTQVGAWQVTAYTRGAAGPFDHCTLYRVQSQGFGLGVGYTAHGVWTVGAEAPDWGLTAKESYTATLQVGGTSYTATGRAFNGRGMGFSVAPEIFGELKSGQQFTVSANQKRFTISLDGIEAALQRTRDCVKQYAAASPAVPPLPPGHAATLPGASGSLLVTAIQSLLTRLGYDPGPINGVAGLKTNMAISAFQKSIGERGDGLPSDTVRSQLEKAVASRAPAGGQGNGPGGVPKAVGAGTGFFIAPDTVVTNFHVVNGCVDLRLRKNGGDLGKARVVATSRADDLAALRVQTQSKTFLKLRVGAPIKPAEPVLVFGYPLADALSSAGNTTLGNVTALSGLRDDSRFIQISAAVQPGNSGGPAVDEAGRLMGVVVSKLNAVAIARLTGDIPQNVNFAIKVTTLVNFLEAHNIAYEPADPAAREVPATERAARAEAASTQVECWK
ncbi:MAG: trypsin-like peptidase domain-containing protein [Reyranella sp.]|uniref:serine protease n=1 Tax=Reyranella sp. TaxID=1929291 RepID=UPI001AC98A3F|nr:serine protease [Reyranella sp.]MBN9085900.1 trypsin-like peptidase domain-containing protein [Reyranella sp.]